LARRIIGYGGASPPLDEESRVPYPRAVMPRLVTNVGNSVMIKHSIVFILALVVSAGAAWAHHGWGSYDASKGFTISAPVEALTWADPHVHLTLNYEGVMWQATLAPVSRMQTRGLSQDMLKPSTPVVVEGYPSTRNAHEMRAERITVAGKTVELR